jgi:hypothetical protein
LPRYYNADIVEATLVYRQLTIEKILAWADAYHEAMGQWPTRKSGAIAGTVCETWAGVDRALNRGALGLPGGSSLARLLVEYRGVRYASFMPPLTEEQTLAWADAYHERDRTWPTTASGAIQDASFERWNLIDDALREGARGLPGGSSLRQLLAEHRGVRNPRALLRLTQPRILAWADRFHQQTGKWPTEHSGLIPDSGGETWNAIDTALGKGKRGLPGGSSLPKLLATVRGVRNIKSLPELTVQLVLAWADEHLARTGEWPTVRSGAILEAPGETWGAVNAVLVRGSRGLPGGTTLARLLAAERGVRNHMDLPPLLIRQLLAWADAHLQRHGNWPGQGSGVIPEAPEVTWGAVDTALRVGLRGLPGGSSLAELLVEKRGKRNCQMLPPLRIKHILTWADAYRARTGRWPARSSGAIPEAPGETWGAVDTALKDGLRGLPGGESLARLLARKRGARHRKELPPLSVEQVLGWADDHHERTGTWPSRASGAIPGTRGETWKSVDRALQRGRRGLPGGTSLAALLNEWRRSGRQTPASA